MSLLAVDGVVVGYGAMDVLHNVSIEVNPGEIVSIIGPNGSGKSTLMKAIFGLLKPKQGAVLFNGDDITGLPPHKVVRRGLCYVPQAENVFLSLTVQENLEMGGFILNGGVRERAELVYGLFPDLKGAQHKRVGRLSGGQRQMVALGRSLMLEPRLLLLDEPSAGLSPIYVDSIFQRVLEINQSGVTILIVEQNARKALSISHRAYVLAAGENRHQGPAADLLANEEVRRAYLGG